MRRPPRRCCIGVIARSARGVCRPLGGLHNLLIGWIALHQSPTDGRRQILSFALPGAVIGVEAETIALFTSESAAGLVPGGVGYWAGEIAAPMGRIASGGSSNS